MSNKEIIRQFEPRQDNLLMMLHALQDAHPQQYLSEEALREVAAYLGLTLSSVYGVARYYTMFSLEPRGKYLIRVCASAVCELMKYRVILSSLEQELGIRPGETTPCGLFSLELAECLGQCQEAPSMMINREVYNGLTPDRIRAILNQLREAAKAL